MTFLQAIILGIVQGLTEFIPVSSSGHLVLVPHFLGWQFAKEQAFIFDVLVQWGTLFSVFIYFWKDLVAIAKAFLQGVIRREPFAEPDSRMGWYLIIATLPAVVFGLLGKDLIEHAFASAEMTGYFLFLTAILLVIAETVGQRNRRMEEITWLDSLLIGFSQVLALLPGVSRSGATIAGGMTRHLDRSAAARFSFLMSVPVMLGAGLLALKDLAELPGLNDFILPLLAGFLAALVSGYIAIRWLIAYLSKHSLYLFAVYCTVLGLIVILSV
ncbi:undecaprenyl-diphosphatase UppP [Desulfobulbus sp. US2]|uniref:Undecaprenyl-diphosphatase n=1 Tax=Candidatus Electrothrix communis TaxID=1859133 RepID=A0A444J8Z9_9BACT|nr:undecaprenyl-diphosphatase UppP [Desulfobulbus sp. US4]MCW5207429.1 undecaprenyl-diphosphatase UppP [Desulfobulbus sp. US2]RWX49529.1 undecaprenyl-diphosphatase [Candidatus Electrothrix communis]WLE97035.1 MAG: undecaprenyl-diphosphatase UppP [Candidatus Electrothrix communis]